MNLKFRYFVQTNLLDFVMLTDQVRSQERVIYNKERGPVPIQDGFSCGATR